MLLRMTRWPLIAFALFACSHRPAPVVELSDDAIPGLIDVELQRSAMCRWVTCADETLPGKRLDSEIVEDPEWGDEVAQEVDVELQVDPAEETATLAALRARKDVIWAEPVMKYQALWLPNDPDFSKQWHLKAAGAPQAWDSARGAGVTVAVIDTGIFPVDDLDASRIVKGHNFVGKNEDATDDHGHGTHVAGTIAQSTGNGVGVAGMAPEARLMPIKVLSAFGGGTSHDIAEGIRWAADHGARVLNLSLGGGGRSLAMESAVAYARRKGAVVVCAAGNGGGPGVSYPAAYDGAFAVSAVGPQGKLAPYSSYGREVAIAAPGGDKSQGEEAGVLQETIDRQGKPAYLWFQGTSMATPHVAGAAALIMSLGVTSPGAVERLITGTARKAGEKDKYGAGLLDAAAAVRAVTLWWDLWRLALAAFGAWFAVKHARKLGHVKETSPLLWAGVALGAGAYTAVAPMLHVSLAALPPAALLAKVSPWLGWSALAPFVIALASRAFKARWLAAGIAFGWAGMLLQAALWRTVDFAYLPAFVAPFWLLLNAGFAWMAGRGLLAREPLR